MTPQRIFAAPPAPTLRESGAWAFDENVTPPGAGAEDWLDLDVEPPRVEALDEETTRRSKARAKRPIGATTTADRGAAATKRSGAAPPRRSGAAPAAPADPPSPEFDFARRPGEDADAPEVGSVVKAAVGKSARGRADAPRGIAAGTRARLERLSLGLRGRGAGSRIRRAGA